MNPLGDRDICLGDRVTVDPFDEEAEVIGITQRDGGVSLRIIFHPSERVQTFFFSHDEFRQRVHPQGDVWERWLRKSLPPANFVLFVESLRMRLAYAFDPHYAVSVSQVDLLPHQVEAVYGHMLRMPRIRFLLADDPGLGKTIMAGLLLEELEARRQLRSVLLVVPAHLLDQWQREMEEWFCKSFVLLTSSLSQERNPEDFFQRNPHLIVSMDLARRPPMRHLLAQRHWDLVVIDEAHKLSATRYGKKIEKTQRYQLGEALAAKTNHLLLLTATPHKGDDHAYLLLLNLLEPRLFTTVDQLKNAARSDHGLPFVLRRTKEQVTDLQGQKLFPPRRVNTVSVHLTDAERRLYDAVTDYVRQWYKTVVNKNDRRSRNIALALTVLQRRLSSSLFAIQKSLERRQAKLKGLLELWHRCPGASDLPLDDEDEETFDEDNFEPAELEEFFQQLEGVTAARSLPELREELQQLEDLIDLARQAAQVGEEAKLQHLRQVVEEHLRHHPEEKLLIFTEFKDTLLWLQRRLQDWGFPCALIHGEKKLSERITEERAFRDRLQIMVATDAGGEGINLQFCRLMLNYDLPWNPNRLEQRMGRIHRYGQSRECHIFNLLYADTREGDVLARLLRKLDQMRERLGDTVYDVIGAQLSGTPLKELIMEAVLRDRVQEDLVKKLDAEIEQRINEYRRVLDEYALAGHRLDLSRIRKDDVESRLRRLVPWDVERFLREAARIPGGSLKPDPQDRRVFRLELSKEFSAQHKLTSPCTLRVAFDRKLARQLDAEFLAPGHPILEAFLDHFLQNTPPPVFGLLRDPRGREGSLWIYRISLQDGRGQPAREALLALFHDRASHQIREVDPRMLWDFQLVSHRECDLSPTTKDYLQQTNQIAQEYVFVRLDQFKREAEAQRQRDYDIKKRWLQESYTQLKQDSQRKLWDYYKRRDNGEEMDAAIRQEEENFKKLGLEQAEREKELEKERQLILVEPRLQAVALILPATATATHDDASLKRRIEEVGMSLAMDYERQQGRTPEDVSPCFLGYDILSHAQTQSRYIEVKAFATTGAVELTPHEWQMAQRLGQDYWLYVVEEALTQPRLRTIQDPANNLSAQPILGVIKVVIENWKEPQT